MESWRGPGGRPGTGVRPSVLEKKNQPVPINRKTTPKNLAPPSLAEKVGIGIPGPQKPEARSINPRPATKPEKDLVFHRPAPNKEVTQKGEVSRSVVPVNRRVVKPSKIKHIQRTKGQPGETVVIKSGAAEKSQQAPAKSMPINRKVVKQNPIKHLEKAKQETPTAINQAKSARDITLPTPAKAMPINRKVIKPRESDVFLNSEPRKDEVSVIRSDEYQEPHTATPNGESGSADQPISIAGLASDNSGKTKHGLGQNAAPLEGKWPVQNPETTSQENDQNANELQMVPVEGGRAYQDTKIESLEATHRQRDIATAKKDASHHREQLDMVPIEAGHRERQLSMKPIDNGRRRPDAALVQEEPKAAKTSPDMVRDPSPGKKQVSRSPIPKRAEKKLGNFVVDLRSEAARQDFPLQVDPRKNMRVDFSTQSKALSVAFQKRALPFDKIVVRQMIPPHLERRQSDRRTELEPKSGFIDKVKAMFGIRKQEKRSVERREMQDRHLVGHFCSEKKKVIDWEFASPKTISEPTTTSQVPVAAQYKIEGKRNFWSVQLINEANPASYEGSQPKAHPHISESGIKQSLFVLLNGLGDAIHGDLVKAT